MFHIDIMGKCRSPHCQVGNSYISNWHHGQVLYFTLRPWLSAIFHIDNMVKCYISNWSHGQVLCFILRQWEVLYFTSTSSTCVYYTLRHGYVLNVALIPWKNPIFQITSWASPMFPIAIMGKCYDLHWHHGIVLYFTLPLWASVMFHFDNMGKFYILHGHLRQVLYSKLTS